MSPAASLPDPRPIHLTPVLPDGRSAEPITLSVREAGEGPPIVLCHGFPELSRCWANQFGVLVDAGYRVIAPDQRGVGESDRPDSIDAYDLGHLTGDLIGLLDALAIERAIFVGHDFGGEVSWPLGVLHPDRVAALVGVNTPYVARAKTPPIATLRRKWFGFDRLNYLLWFQQPGVADPILSRDARLLYQKLVRGGVRPWWGILRYVLSGHLDMNPFAHLESMPVLGYPLLSESELDVYVETFQRTGFTGGLSGYRNFDRNWRDFPSVGVSTIDSPSLMITAEWDPALTPSMATAMRTLVADLEIHEIPRCGHWTMYDAPDALASILLPFLRRVSPSR